MNSPAISDEALRRAYAELHKPGWPSLEELRDAYVHFSAVQGLARSMAQRPALFGRPVHQAAPTPHAPMSTLAAALKHPLAAHDGRLAASGEYAGQGDD